MLLALIFHKRLANITQDHATIQFICVGLHVDVYCLQCFPFHSHGSIFLMRASSPFHKTAVCVCIGVLFFHRSATPNSTAYVYIVKCIYNIHNNVWVSIFHYLLPLLLSFICCLDDSDSGSVSVTQREEDVLLGLL